MLALALAAATVAHAQGIDDLDSSISNALVPGDPLHRTFAQVIGEIQQWRRSAAAAEAAGIVGPEPMISNAAVAPPGSAQWQDEMRAHNTWMAQVQAYQDSMGLDQAGPDRTEPDATETGTSAVGPGVEDTGPGETLQGE